MDMIRLQFTWNVYNDTKRLINGSMDQINGCIIFNEVARFILT